MNSSLNTVYKKSRLIDRGQRVLYSNIVTLPMNKYECHFCNSRRIEETTGDGRLSCNLFQFEKAWSSRIGPAKRCSLLSALLKRWMNCDALKCDNCCFSSLLAESLPSDHFCRQASGSVINLN
ncbi:hypothetical protein T01_9841 [Trichinella spiralis]|uniref:Uncharacterized protein n=1 Tax=Trichinella spiralis TaxID=6334 RepID=A0A0V1BAJ3_TRISP|nr:hypothetical protein T01_9841 [Trichinella spiralis]